MKYGIVETDDIVIGKVKDMISYLKKIETEIKRKETLDGVGREKETQEIRKIILKLKYEFIINEVVYLKRNLNGDISLYLLDTDLL